MTYGGFEEDIVVSFDVITDVADGAGDVWRLDVDVGHHRWSVGTSVMENI